MIAFFFNVFLLRRRSNSYGVVSSFSCTSSFNNSYKYILYSFRLSIGIKNSSISLLLFCCLYMLLNRNIYVLLIVFSNLLINRICIHIEVQMHSRNQAVQIKYTSLNLLSTVYMCNLDKQEA